MKLLTRYLIKEVYSSTLAIFVILMGIFLSNQVVRFLKAAAFESLASNSIKIIILLQFPILAAIVLPIALYLGIVFAFSKLHTNSEMIILFSCGLDSRKIISITLKFTTVVIIIVTLLSFWINPKIYRYFDHLKSAYADNLELIKPKRFNEVANGSWVFYVNSISDDKTRFHMVFAAQQSNQPLKKNRLSSLVAKSAYHKIDPNTGNSYLVLVDGYRYVGQPGHADYEVIKYKEYGIKVPTKKESWQGDESSIDTMTLWNTRSNVKAIAELHWRLAIPLLTIILTLLAIPLSKTSPREGRYLKTIPAILLCTVYVNLILLAKTWLKNQLIMPEFGMWWIHGPMLIIAFGLIVRPSKWQRYHRSSK